jgi:glutamate carboxypeptidase
LRLLKSQNFNNFASITVLFNVDEEKGSASSKNLIKSLSSGQDALLSFEPNKENDEALTYSFPGCGTIKVNIIGKSSHAGFSPNLGVNALVEAANFIDLTKPLHNLKNGPRLSWTVCNSGQSSNMIPDNAVIFADVRYKNQTQLEKLIADFQLKSTQKISPESKIEIAFIQATPPFNVETNSQWLLNKAVSIYKEVGGSIKIVDHIWFNTDAVWASESNIPVIFGLGLPGSGFHSTGREPVQVDAIPRRLYLVTQLIIDISNNT